MYEESILIEVVLRGLRNVELEPQDASEAVVHVLHVLLMLPASSNRQSIYPSLGVKFNVIYPSTQTLVLAKVLAHRWVGASLVTLVCCVVDQRAPYSS